MRLGNRSPAFAGILALLTLSGCATVPASTPRAAPATAAATTVPPAMQWLFGSGEGGTASLQAYRALRDHVLRSARARPADSVVLAEGSTLASPRFVPCARKPLAVMLDVDETAIQNLGYEYDEAVRGRSFDSAAWNRWERTGERSVAPMPGAVEALRAIRAAGIEVIFNSNRQAANAAHTEAALDFAGLGPARHGETLFLQGDIAPGSGKDPRRAAVAGRWCVIAMAGDQLGDFSDLFNARTLPVGERRRAAVEGPFAGLWGNGWFMLSNPVYGPGLRGGFDDIFPQDRRWSDPGERE
ncbi:5'-nucleotidase, lipoprotein e(P4) family [Sphingosinicella sp. CPCC 101087]|uniref:5'-nucleotidase, lipoprotein e(P4) family n=1 Tax=Sphingosinicella sp. CPCC 101087 TaxID=2497754 RepID=UPI00101D9C41|nr:HAD family acid phosphatase [Sphingosinicella sp. CPCC 101087]